MVSGPGDITMYFIYIFKDPHGKALEDLDLQNSHLTKEVFFLC